MSAIRVTKTELWRLSAMELAAAIRSKEVSSQEVVEAHLRRIEAVNPRVNAVPVVLAEEALDAATVADRRVPVGTDLPFKVGADRTPAGVVDNLRVMRMVMAVNALGLPAVAVPVGVEDGLPQVVQLIGPRCREDLCLDAAKALEERHGIITPIDPR